MIAVLGYSASAAFLTWTATFYSACTLKRHVLFQMPLLLPIMVRLFVVQRSDVVTPSYLV